MSENVRDYGEQNKKIKDFVENIDKGFETVSGTISRRIEPKPEADRPMQIPAVVRSLRYCKNCRHRKLFKYFTWHAYYCLDVNSIGQNGSFSGQWCEFKNENNYCEQYNRIWWKIWVN